MRVSLYKDGFLRPPTENTHVNTAASYPQRATATLSFNADGTVQTTTSTLDTHRVSSAQRSIYLNKDNTGDNSLTKNADNPYGWRDHNKRTQHG